MDMRKNALYLSLAALIIVAIIYYYRRRAYCSLAVAAETTQIPFVDCNAQCSQQALCEELQVQVFQPPYKGPANPIIPSNFADQYEANEPTPYRHFRQPVNTADGVWTVDITEPEKSFSDYVPAKQDPSMREQFYNPSMQQGIRSGIQEWRVVEGLY